MENYVLAEVGGRKITRQDADLLIRTLNPQTAAQFKSEAGFKRLVDELVNQELFYFEAVEKNIENEQQFKEEMERAKASILKQLAVNKLLSNISISDKEIEEYYKVNQQRFEAQASVKASHILVESEDEATKIATEIAEGLSFEEAAAKYSSCPSKSNGGDLGFFSRGMMVPEFEDAAFSLAENTVSSPVKTQFGFHLIKVAEKKAAGNKSIDEARPEIERELMSEKQQEAYFIKLDELKKKYEVKLSF